MQQLVEQMLYRLSDKGFTPVEIPRLIKDVLYLINGGGEFTVDMINHRLGGLGWGEHVLDQYTLELIIYFLENRGVHTVEVHTIH